MNTIIGRSLALVTLYLLGSLTSSATGATQNILHFRPGLHLSKEQPLTNKQIKGLLRGLRFWTGFNQIAIDAVGDVILGDRADLSNGSASARQLMMAAVDSQDSFIVENHDHSPEIAFARIQAEVDCDDKTGVRHHGWRIQIDFSDFHQLRGEARVVESFDPAINLLHELVHGLWGYHDPLEASDQLGQCESHINRIRAEVGLPSRLRYYARNKIVRAGDPWTGIAQADLVFSVGNRNRESLLSFNLRDVVDISKAKSNSASEVAVIALKKDPWH